MATLLELGDQIQALHQLIEEREGDITEIEAIIDQWLAESQGDLERKLDSYAALVRELTLRAAARKEEMERLAMRVRVDERTVTGLKERLLLFLGQQGLRQVETARYKIAVQNNGGVQPLEVLVPVDQLDDAYVRVRREIDMDKLRQAIADGVAVPARLKPRGSHIRIS